MTIFYQLPEDGLADAEPDRNWFLEPCEGCSHDDAGLLQCPGCGEAQ